MSILFHNTYSRYDALEVIREQAFRACSEEGESFQECHETAEGVYQFYLRCSNKVLEGQLEDIFNYRPTVTTN